MANLGPLFSRSGQDLLRYASLGLEMGVAVAIGLGIGWWLDRHFGTQPWLTLLFVLFGIAAGFKNLYLLARRQMRDNDDDGRAPRA